MPDAVLDFWFREIDPKLWWTHDPAFDDVIRTRYGALLERATAGELYPWRATARGRLAAPSKCLPLTSSWVSSKKTSR